MRRWIILIALILLLPAGYVLYGMGDAPRYKYTVHQTKLLVDGEEVTVTGLLECVHIPFPYFSEGPDYRMRGGTTAAAARLKDGGAVLTMFANACDGESYKYAPGYYPRIYLIDSATDPQRIDYYFSADSLRDPNSRVQLVDFTTHRSSSPIRSYRLLARYRWDMLASALPGLMDDPAMYVGYAMTVLPFAELTAEERPVVERYKVTEGGGVARIQANSPETRHGVQSLLERTNPTISGTAGSWCQLDTPAERSAACRKLQRTFGLPVVDGVATLRSAAELLPYIEYVRRADMPGADDNGRRRYGWIEDVTTFSLFGTTEALTPRDIIAVSIAPEREFVFGLDVELLSRDRILKQGF